MVWIIIAIILFAGGILGVFLPFLPSLPLAWLGLLIYAAGTDFEKIGVLSLVVFLIGTIILTALDFVAPLIGMQKFKPSKWGMIGATIGLFVGIFIFGPFGIVLGPFLGALIGELVVGREIQSALHSSAGALVGFLVLSLLKTLFIFIMFGFFLFAVFK